MATTTLNLYRSVRKEDFPDGVIVMDSAADGVLYPTFTDKTIEVKGVGRVRRADVRPFDDKGEQVVDPGGGTSLFDKANVFGKKFWWCFTIPKGTVIPDSLKVIFTGHNDTYNADHYQIEAKTRISVVAFKGALDNFARNAVEKQYKDARI